LATRLAHSGVEVRSKMRILGYNQDNGRQVATETVTKSKNEHKTHSPEITKEEFTNIPTVRPVSRSPIADCFLQAKRNFRCGEKDAQIWILRGDNGRMNIDDEPMHTAERWAS